MLLARDEASWASGLQGVTALAGVDGLLFVFPEDIEAPFWMRGAEVPLDIAFYDASGNWLASFSMPVCREDPCHRYRPDRPYRYALETTPGRLTGASPSGRLHLDQQ